MSTIHRLDSKLGSTRPRSAVRILTARNDGTSPSSYHHPWGSQCPYTPSRTTSTTPPTPSRPRPLHILHRTTPGPVDFKGREGRNKKDGSYKGLVHNTRPVRRSMTPGSYPNYIGPSRNMYGMNGLGAPATR